MAVQIELRQVVVGEPVVTVCDRFAVAEVAAAHGLDRVRVHQLQLTGDRTAVERRGAPGGKGVK